MKYEETHPLAWNINEPILVHKDSYRNDTPFEVWPWVWAPMPKVGCLYFKTLTDFRYNEQYRKCFKKYSHGRVNEYLLKMINYFDWASNKGEKCVVGTLNELRAAAYLEPTRLFGTYLKKLEEYELIYYWKSDYVKFLVIVLRSGPLYKKLIEKGQISVI